MTIDEQITSAMCEAETALMKQARLRELNMRSAEIKLSLGRKDRIMSEGTRLILTRLIARRVK